MHNSTAALVTALALFVPGCAVNPNETAAPPGTIAFSSNRSGRYQLYACSEDGSDLRLLTKSEIDDTNPRWSPAGDRLAFIAGDTLSLLDPETGIRRSLGVTADPYVPLCSLPTGDRILCMSGEQLVCVEVDAKRVSKIAQGSIHATWMPDSDQLLATRGQIPLLQVMSGDEFVRYFLQGGIGSAFIPQLLATWSRADPPRCAFSSSPDPASGALAYDVFVAAADGTGVRSVFGTNRTDWACDWSPDGKALLIQSEDDGASDLFVVWVDERRQLNLTNDAALERGASWKP